MVKVFFTRWKQGIKNYYSSPIGLLFVKLWFLGFVVVGLLFGSVQRFQSGDLSLAWILFFFGLLMAVDFRLLLLSYRKAKSFEELM